MELGFRVREMLLRHFSIIATTLVALMWWLPKLSSAQELGSSLYMRSDTDGTTVISPRLRAAGQVDSETRVDASYTVDVWSSASIDIRSAATKRIYEQRDELDFAASHIIDSSTLSASYRYSKENDYESHGGTASLSQDFAEKATNLLLSLSGIFDTVGRSGDTDFAKPLSTLGARAALTQILDPEMLVQLSYDIFLLNGFQESPYRKVRLLDSSVPGCVPPEDPLSLAATDLNGCRIYEKVPDSRMRHAFAIQGRRSLGSDMSIGLGYRFYLDNWNLKSHTVEARIAYLPSDDVTLTLRYRFYTQGAASFYKPYYTDSDTDRTNDRELSSLTSHRIGLDAEREFSVGPLTINGALSAGITHYDYAEFPGLSTVQAFELTTALSSEF